MVEYKVIIGDEAKQNLKLIVNWLKENGSEQIAKKVKNGIVESIVKLAIMPERHAVVQEIKNNKYEYRRVLKWSYKIVFIVEKEEFTVKIVDIIHSKRNPEILEDRFGN